MNVNTIQHFLGLDSSSLPCLLGGWGRSQNSGPAFVLSNAYSINLKFHEVVTLYKTIKLFCASFKFLIALPSPLTTILI